MSFKPLFLTLSLVLSPFAIADKATYKVAVINYAQETCTFCPGGDADIEIAETHHRRKIDAPSGTALAMGEVIAGVRGVPLDTIADYDRASHREPRRAGSLGFSVSRLGDVVGDHTVSFGSDSERLEITHKASSRDAFAMGALKAARWLVTKPSGCYDMNDVLGLKRSDHE